MQRSASTPTLLGMNAYWAGLSFMWNALHPIVLPAVVASYVPGGSRNTYLGLLTFAGLLIAMLIQPVFGSLSDRWISRYGRRRPLMAIGTLSDCIFLFILGWIGGLAWVLVGYVGLQISSNAAQAPLQGLIRDRVPFQQLGVASSLKILLDLVSLVAAALVAGRLMATGTRGTHLVILVILGLLLASAAITIFFTHEEPAEHAAGHVRTVTRLVAASTERIRSSYWWLIGERGAFLLGVYGLQAFGQYYLQDALDVPDPAQQSGNLLAVIGAGTLVLALAGGWLADRYGAKRLLYTASGMASIGMLLMVLITDMRGLYLIGSVIGAGIGLFLTSNWAMANQFAPPAQSGRYLGLTNLATAGAAALARLEGPAVDILNTAQAGAWFGYKGIFVFGALCILASTWFLAKVE